MEKFRVHYKLTGLGDFFVEAPSVALAYEKMYECFEDDNSLIVHAKYPYGFEIIGSSTYEGDFPKKSKSRVTTSEELRAARFRDTLDVVEIPRPIKFLDTGLFDFDSGAEPEKS